MRATVLHAGRALVDGVLVDDCTVTVEAGVIVDIRIDAPAPSSAGALVCPDGVLAPGLIDLHVHALDGAGMLDDDAVDVAGLARALVRRGVTGFLATTVAAPVDALERALAKVPPVDTVDGARCLGVHLEGPWLSTARPGAQPMHHLALPDLASLDRLIAAGPVAMVTIAPELAGADEVIRAASTRGVVVAMGHSDATYDEARAATAAGARHVTHCFNAMSPLHHRQPGLAGAALDLEEVTVEAIGDGVHLHPAVVRLLWRARGAERICLVSDAVDVGAASTLVPGSDGALRRADGVLAGSAIGLDTAVRNAVSWGIPLVDALTMASSTPAGVLQRTDLGRIAVGARADLVLFDAALQVQTVVVDGGIAVEAAS